MLVLSRKRGESLTIDGNIRVCVVDIDRNSVRIGIEAPPEIPVLREEAVVRGPKPDAQAGAPAAEA
jgi:carbon storage regulator